MVCKSVGARTGKSHIRIFEAQSTNSSIKMILFLLILNFLQHTNKFSNANMPIVMYE
jgi:hypothetical protein